MWASSSSILLHRLDTMCSAFLIDESKASGKIGELRRVKSTLSFTLAVGRRFEIAGMIGLWRRTGERGAI